MDSKGQSINRPSLFKGENFELWKLKMTPFLEYSNVDLIEVIEIEVSSLLDTTRKFLPKNTWSNKQKSLQEILDLLTDYYI